MQVSKSLTCRARDTLRQDVVAKSSSLGPCSSEMMPKSALWRAFRNYERFPLGQKGRYQPDCYMCKVQQPASAADTTSEIASPILKGLGTTYAAVQPLSFPQHVSADCNRIMWSHILCAFLKQVGLQREWAPDRTATQLQLIKEKAALLGT